MPPQAAAAETDWFSQNAPPSKPIKSVRPPSSSDWFADNAPIGGRPSESAQAAALAPSTMAAARRGATVPMDYAGMEAGGGGAPSKETGIPAPPPPLRPAGETLAEGATRELGPSAKWAGAGLLTMAAPEVGLPAAVGLAGLGGAGGEAAHQIAQHAVTPKEAPKSAAESATNIGIAGAETGSAELIGKGTLKVAGAVAKRFLNPAGQAIEDVFRAAGPPSDPGFRSNVEVAANDLGNAYKRTPIPPEAKGGIINPDMRIRSSVDAINNELKSIYLTERVPQIARATQAGAQVQLRSVDSAVLTDISKRLSRTLPINDPAIGAVQKLMADPRSVLSVAETDSLGRAVNTMLRDFESMTPADRAAAGITRRMAGLKDLDRGISTDLNGRLRQLGLPGLEDYERRYAAMSSVRDGLERGMNKAEASRWSMRLREFFSPSGIHGGVSGNLSISPGRRIESGMRTMAETSTPTPTLPPPPSAAAGPAPPAPIPAPPAAAASPVGVPPPLEFPPRTPNAMWSGVQPKAGFDQPSAMVSSVRPPENVKGPSVRADAGAKGSSAPTFYRSEAAPLARKYGLIPREPSAPGLVSFQDSTTGGSIEMKDGFTEDQLAAKVKAHRDAMAATSAGGKSDLQATKRAAATSRFAHEAAPATGTVKAEMGKLKLFDLVTPRQQTTLETLMRGPRWRDMEAVDRSAAIKAVLQGGKPTS